MAEFAWKHGGSMGERTIEGRDPGSGDGIALTISGEGITSIVPAHVSSDLWISPGLVDLQVNGFAGFDLNGPALSAETVSGLTRCLLQLGTTSFAPTLITASEEDLLYRLKCIDDACRTDPIAAACIPFIHIEGPSISPLDGFRGAHPLEHVRPPSLAEFERWQAACNQRIGMVTLSPHFAEAERYIASLSERGVHVSLGHTNATHEQLETATKAGARLSTHLGNGIALQIDRHLNPIWSQLADKRLTASFIADGHHLPEQVLISMMRAKGLGRCILVSDAVALAGMPPGTYETTIGGHVHLSPEGRLSIDGTSLLAGSASSLLRCVEAAVRMTGLPLATLLKMATEIPGRFAGRGRLHPGARADIMRFRWNDTLNTATIHDVWVAGEHFYHA
ncbi:MAG: amidohydrolase family protein [Acidobacteria bacterium]|nr:amidohydrolase family protein [Acidobacteriota bacterium]